MPAVAERLRAEFSWEPKVADPDLAVAKGAALYAAGQTVKLVEAEAAARAAGTQDARAGERQPAAALCRPASRAEAAIAAVTERTGMDAEQVADVVRTVVNVLPKAVGIKLVDTDRTRLGQAPDR